MMISFCEYPTAETTALLSNDEHCLTPFKNVLIGTEFCYRKLYRMNIEDVQDIVEHVHSKQKNIYFVLPIIPEREITHFRNFTEELADTNIDGIVINDYGSLYYLSLKFPNLKLIIGRLLFKTPRNYDYNENHFVSNKFPFEIITILSLFKNIIQIHIDVDYIIDDSCMPLFKGIKIFSHQFIYQTSTMRCEYKRNSKFDCYTVKGTCKFECQNQIIRIGEKPTYRVGNAIVFRRTYNSNYLPIIDYSLNSHINNENISAIKSDL